MIQFGSFEEYQFTADQVKTLGCFNFTNNGECSKCGSCCSALLPLKKSEIDRLRRLIKVRHIKPHEQPKVVTVVDLTCPFLSDDNKCRIYDERPYICKTFMCNRKFADIDLAELDEQFYPINVRDLF